MNANPGTAAPFLTLAQLRDEHTLLTSRFRGQPGDTAVMAAAESFVARASATGAVLDASAERAAAQTMLDYWATVLFRHTSKEVAATLDDFRPARDKVLDDRDCPYPGIQPFDAAQRTLFHGREELVRELVSLLQRQECVCLIGEAGVGKTSLLQAGLLPALRDQGRDPLPTIVPGSDPLGSLAKAIFGWDALPPDFPERSRAASFFTHGIDEAAPHGGVLVVDGLEELFMLCTQEEARARFASAIAQIVSSGRNHLVILTIRSTWTSSLAALEELDGLVKRYPKQVPALSGPQVTAAVVSPAARVGLTFDEGLAETIGRDFLNEPLVLLQLTMTTLWRRREGTRISWPTYSAMGRGRTLVCNQAETLGFVAGSANEPGLRAVMLAFVEQRTLPGQIRTLRIERERLLDLVDSPGTAATIDRLVEGALLRSSASTTGLVRYEWLHSVLKDAVPLIGTWIHDQELEAARALAARERARADMEAGLKRKARRRAYGFAVAAVTAFFLMFVTLRQLSQREVLNLASASDRVAAVNPDLALALAAHALDRAPASPEAAGAMYKVYFEYPTRRVYPPIAGSSPGEVLAVAATKDGRYAVAGDTDGTLSVLDLQSTERTPLPRLDPAQGAISAVAFAPDGDVVMAGTASGAIALFDRTTGTRRALWTHHEQGKRIHSLAFSPDGQTAASASADDTVWMSRRTGADFGPWRQLDAGGNGHRTSVRALAFDPKARVLFSGEERDGKVIAWSLDTAEFIGSGDLARLGAAADAQAELRSLAVAPAGCAFLAGLTNGTVMLVDIREAMRLAPGSHGSACPDIPAPLAVAGVPDRSGVTGVVFAPDGRSAVSKSQNGATALWRIEPGHLALVKTFAAHLSPVRAVVFPNVEFFVSGHADGSVRAWSLDAGLDDDHFTMEAALADGGAPSAISVHSVGLSGDGRNAYAASHHLNQVTVSRRDVAAATTTRLLTIDYSGIVPPMIERTASRVLTGVNGGLQIYNLASPEPQSTRYPTNAVAATLNGPTLAWISDGDWNLLVADAHASAPPRRVATLPSPPDGGNLLFAMAGSADGRWVAVGTQPAAGAQDGRVWLYDARAASGGLAHELVQHGGVTALAFHPDGQRLAAASSDGMITVWNVAGRSREVGRLRGHTSRVNALAFSPDGVLLLSAANGAEGLLLWHVESRLIVHAFSGQMSMLSATFGAAGDRAVTGSSDGVVRVWRLPRLNQRDLLDDVRAKRSVRALTADERREFGLTAWLESVHKMLDLLHLERLLQ